MSPEAVQHALAEFCTVDDAARIAGVHAATVRRAFDARQLDGIRSAMFGRLILRSSAECWAVERKNSRAGRLAA